MGEMNPGSKLAIMLIIVAVIIRSVFTFIGTVKRLSGAEEVLSSEEYVSSNVKDDVYREESGAKGLPALIVAILLFILNLKISKKLKSAAKQEGVVLLYSIGKYKINYDNEKGKVTIHY